MELREFSRLRTCGSNYQTEDRLIDILRRREVLIFEDHISNFYVLMSFIV